MMLRRLLCGVMVVLVAVGPAWADVFDNVLKGLMTDSGGAVSIEQVRRTYYHSGESWLGGVVPGYPQYQSYTSGTDFRINTPCGSFSLTPQGVLENLEEMLDPDRLKQALLKAVQDSIKNLIGAAISKLSMLTVCYAVPTLCDLTKHMQAVSGQLHNIRALGCQQMEGLVDSVSGAFSRGRTSRCVSSQIQAGMTLNSAQRVCATGEWEASAGAMDDVGGLTIPGVTPVASTGGGAFADDPVVDPNDPYDDASLGTGERTKQRIVADGIEHAYKEEIDAATGARRAALLEEMSELKRFAKRTLGEVTIEDRDVDTDGDGTGGGDEDNVATGVKPEGPTHRVYDVYEAEAGKLKTLLDCAVDSVGAVRMQGGNLPTPTASAACQGVPVDPLEPGGATFNVSMADGGAEAIQLVSLPNLTMPVVVLQNLHELKQEGDQMQYDVMAEKLAGNIALLKTVWKTQEARERLEAGSLSKEDQTEEERQQLLNRARRVEREGERMLLEKKMTEEHIVPIMQAVVDVMDLRRAAAASEFIDAPTDRRFGRQNPFGYGF